MIVEKVHAWIAAWPCGIVALHASAVAEQGVLEDPLQEEASRSTRAHHDEVFPRSEEHTSELQSQEHIAYAVFCLTALSSLQQRSLRESSALMGLSSRDGLSRRRCTV